MFFGLARIDAGELLGVSLKKAPEQVHIYRINFTQKENQQLLENVKYFDISENNLEAFTNSEGIKNEMSFSANSPSR